MHFHLRIQKLMLFTSNGSVGEIGHQHIDALAAAVSPLAILPSTYCLTIFLSLFYLDPFISIQESISRTEASNLHFFSSISIRDGVSIVTYNCLSFA